MNQCFRTIIIGIAMGILSSTTATPRPANLIRKYETNVGTGTISGIVMDESGLTVPGVLLKLDKDKHYTISNLNGEFIFLNVPPGRYTLLISYIGFEDFKKQIVVRQDNDTRVNIRLHEKAYLTNEVTVYGNLAKGQARALSVQKNNMNITNMIASDQMGRFPDSNVGDAIKRIPGVTIQTDQGEARNLILRGLSSALSSVTLNGSRIPSAEGDNRNIQLDLIPAEMIQTMEVNKTLLPNMEADAIGGSVNLVTKSAPQRQYISADLYGGYNIIRNKPNYGGSLTYGNRFAQDRLGLVLSLSHQTRDYGSDNVEGVWAQKNGEIYMSEFEQRYYMVKRARSSASINLDLRLNDLNKLYIKTIYNWRNDWENRYAYAIKGINPVSGASNTYSAKMKRSLKMGKVGPHSSEGRRLENQQMVNAAVGGDHTFSETLNMKWGASFGRAMERKPNERSTAFVFKKALVKADFSDPRYPVITPQNEAYDHYNADKLLEKDSYTHEDEWSTHADFRTPLSVLDDQKGRLYFGTKLRFKKKVRDNYVAKVSPIGDFAITDFGTFEVDGSKFLNGKGYAPGRFPNPKEIGQLDYADRTKFKYRDLLGDYWTDNYIAHEDIYAGYLRWDQNISRQLLLITGVRVEHTAINYHGNTLTYDENGDAAKGAPTEKKSHYTNVFPNLTIRYQPTEKWVLRSAYSTSLARPNYYALVPFTSINREDHTITVGNPELRSTYAHNIDFNAAYYPGHVSQVSIGGFYKHLTDFIYAYRDNTFDAADFAETFPGQPNPIGNDTWRYSTYRNGDNVDIFGIEAAYQQQLDFLPSFLKNFAVYFNYTFTHSIAKGIRNEDGKLRYNMPIPGTSPHTLNTSISYEDSYFTARLSLNHSAAYVDELGGDEFEDRYYGDQTFLDFNMTAKMGHGLQLYFYANNLLNTPLYFYQKEPDRMMQQEYYKPNFTLGVRYSL